MRPVERERHWVLGAGFVGGGGQRRVDGRCELAQLGCLGRRLEDLHTANARRKTGQVLGQKIECDRGFPAKRGQCAAEMCMWGCMENIAETRVCGGVCMPERQGPQAQTSQTPHLYTSGTDTQTRTQTQSHTHTITGTHARTPRRSGACCSWTRGEQHRWR